MEEQATDIRNHLEEKFGKTVRFSYVDVQSKEMKKYPGIQKMLGMVRLPLTVINDEPRFQGGLSVTSIEDAIGALLV
ncbi:MAG TPA: hypothetical protein VLW47_13020 [Thermodesulfobacteriota bacterium]|nr:hypothetical protein [Thermodesulfobacteriota bacterium]